VQVTPAKDGSVTVVAVNKLAITDGLFISGRQGQFAVVHKDGTVSQYSVDAARSTPAIQIEKVAGVAGAVEVALGQGFACARLGSGEVACWGRNGCGQLGSGDYVTRSTPAKVIGLGDAVAIDAGDESMCAVRKDGRVQCWGCDVFEPESIAHPVPVVDEASSP
jgi:alpha-tubulin suppressor-like RCC1 family protein